MNNATDQQQQQQQTKRTQSILHANYAQFRSALEKHNTTTEMGFKIIWNKSKGSVSAAATVVAQINRASLLGSAAANKGHTRQSQNKIEIQFAAWWQQGNNIVIVATVTTIR